MGLAHLWRSQGKVQEARELVAPVYRWFTEGFDAREGSEGVAGRTAMTGHAQTNTFDAKGDITCPRATGLYEWM